MDKINLINVDLSHNIKRTLNSPILNFMDILEDRRVIYPPWKYTKSEPPKHRRIILGFYEQLNTAYLMQYKIPLYYGINKDKDCTWFDSDSIIYQDPDRWLEIPEELMDNLEAFQMLFPGLIPVKDPLFGIVDYSKDKDEKPAA